MKTKDIVKKFHLDDCTRCQNECAEACPVYRFFGTWHPQNLAGLFLEKGGRDLGDHRLLWNCVTCRACTVACPFDVEFADFIRELRVGRTDYHPAHEGLIHQYQRTQASLPTAHGFKSSKTTPGLKSDKRTKKSHELLAVARQDRLGWVDDALDINGSREIVLFTGCLPFFEIAFKESCGMSSLHTARAAVEVLNRLGVSPTLLEDERCCGRDMYDIGDRDTFRRLATHNIEELKRTRAKTVLTVCPECAYTIAHTYPGSFGELPFVVRHITEFVAENLDRLNFRMQEERLTFHDPCYLCRYLGVTEAPRNILEAISSQPPVEMARSKELAPCCGAGSWINYGGHTRAAVNERIVEAHRSGAEALVTACPKCNILFHEVNPDCSWKQSPIIVRDLMSMVASCLEGKGRKQP